MICVSIGRGRHRHMIAEHKHLAEQGAQLVELRLDYLMTPPNLKRLLAERPCPVVVTCRRQKDGGRWTRSEEDRQMLLRQAIASGVEYVDLKKMSPPRSRGSARPSGSSATTTSRKRRRTCRPCSTRWPPWMRTW